ncbi:MAG: polyribonucleotide nucleotidyltransferase [Chloroflexi bacterium]|nr:polyribonucleotide nucleotidyltransferase [Chloroflexota bacterium]
MFKEYRARIGNDEVIIGTGKLAQQAGGAVTVQMGDVMVLVTATASKTPRPGIDFFPLTVDLEERRASAGKIPGGFFKREGRLSSESILLCRSIDRPIRPLFPEGYRNDVHIVVTPFSVDQDHQIDTLAMLGASVALTISDIPFNGPIGAVAVGYVDGQLVLNPTVSQLKDSSLDLLVAGTRDSVLMIEAGADQIEEGLLMQALHLAHETMQDVITLQETMRAEIGKEKVVGEQHIIDPALLETVRNVAGDEINQLVESGASRAERGEKEAELRARIAEQAGEVGEFEVVEAYETVFRDAMRRRILDTGIRVDGRDLRTIRNLSCEVGLLPRTHGSGLFNRGETQVLTTVTLGTAADEQSIEHLNGLESSERYMHHYNFPPYSTGEAGVMRGPRRREIGHGALAERALLPVLPSGEDFPYTIRTVSEVLSSNGSTSMASTCASTLALLDAGVPLRAPVAGIAMGVITEGDRFAVLTDIQGLEDHLGDMDFKVTGTAKGITAIQLDIKITGLRWEIIEETLQRSKEARLTILDVMNAVIPAPRADLSPYAPRIQTVKIPVDKIGALIGPGGKTIRSITEETGVTINVEDDGTVLVASADGEASRKALERINALTAVPEIGRIYTGKVVRVADFGAFVEFMPGMDGLVHISQLADFHVNKVEDVAREGDELMVMVIDVSPDGKVRLSRQAVLQGWTVEEARSRDQRPSGGSRPRRDDGSRGDRGGRGGYRDRDRR